MSVLQGHLEQITVSAKSIGDLHFPPPGIFTNALLYSQEITALIRDTEPHERALFSVDPHAARGLGTAEKRPVTDPASRRRTIVTTQQRHTSAVARVLGDDMLRQIQQTSREGGRGRRVNVEVLLQGAERLCAAFNVSGTAERITALRDRHTRLSAAVGSYEEKLRNQQVGSSRTDKGDNFDTEGDQGGDATLSASSFAARMAAPSITEDDLRAEEEAIKELESRRRALEEQVAGMEKDLGGLLQ